VEIQSSDSFLTQRPIDIITNGEINPIPWVVSFVSDESFEHSLGAWCGASYRVKIFIN